MRATENRKNRIILLIVVICAGLAVLLISLLFDTFGNRKKPEQTAAQTVTELDIVYAFQNPQWSTAMERVIQSFEQQHPEIILNYEVNYGASVYEDILTKKIARDELGDIVQLKTPEAYAASGLLGEIDSSVAEQCKALYTYNDQTYGTAMVESTWGILYNKQLFRKYGIQIPETYEEFQKVCDILDAHGITPIGVAGADLWHLEYWLNHFFSADVLSQDPDWLKHCMDGETAWTDENTVRMLEHMYGLFQNGYVNDNWINVSDSALSYLMSEETVAMVYTGPWTAAEVQKLNPDIDLGWFFVTDEAGESYAADHFDTYWAVTEECAQDENRYQAAMQFLAYFYSPEIYAEFCRATYTFPIVASDVHYDTGTFGREVSLAMDQADHKISAYIGNEDTPEGFEKRMLETVKDIMNGSCSVQDGADRLQRFWEQYKEEAAE